MKTEKIDLYEYFNIKRPENGVGYLYTYVQERFEEFSADRVRPAMVVIPGGGYAMTSDREGEAIAIAYLTKGFNSFVLKYSVKPVAYPYQLIEGCMAIAYVRENAEKLGIDKDLIAAIGFSAGGHLTGMLATVTDEKEVKEFLGKRADLCKPNAVILSYPVITLLEKTHGGTSENLTQGDEKLKKYLSLQYRVDSNSVPAFIWATVNDGAVPAENSLMMAEAYKAAGVPFELHIFENGVHGLSLATEETAHYNNESLINPPVQKWLELSCTWLRERGFKIKN